jgi:hypothetical protein
MGTLIMRVVGLQLQLVIILNRLLRQHGQHQQLYSQRR